MIVFDRSLLIYRPPQAVFAFFRDKDRQIQPPGSPVLHLDKVSSGSVGIGTRYREVVRIRPLFRAEIHSEITAYQEDKLLEENFQGPGMTGSLRYSFQTHEKGTLLRQQQQLRCAGLLALFEPLVSRAFLPRLERRLVAIKHILEA